MFSKKVLIVILSVFLLSGCAKTKLDNTWLEKANIIDLTYNLNEKNPYWPGAGYFPFKMTIIAGYEKDGVLSEAYSTPIHLGTHFDAPAHFEKGQLTVDKLDAKKLFGDGILIDIEKKCDKNPDYLLTVQDITDWETTNGTIPPESIVLLKTGWSKYWNDYEKYKNADKEGNLHFPAFSKESVEFLVNQRNIKGVGIDNLSGDYGLSKDFPVHHTLMKAGKFILENLANLDKLPAKGFFLIIAPLKIENASGSQARIFAVIQ
ncbi:cyclase family protein [candidate division KSB1 bacterium]|nr:MAG: cyclase family protein [candidate division KSB1 bacterium]